MGNQFCCNEDKNAEDPSKEEENYNNAIYQNIKQYKDEGNPTPSLPNVNTNESKEKNKISNAMNNNNNNKYDSNDFEDIHNMKSSIFDNENENENQNLNEENIDSNANFKALSKNKFKSGNSTNENFGVKINIRKNKDGLDNSEKEFIKIKNVIKDNPDYKNKPLKLKDFNDNKENEFYLINTPKYIGLKNNNNNLVFVKNKIQNSGSFNDVEIIGTKKEFFNEKYKDFKQNKKNNKNKNEENESDNDVKIVYSRYSFSYKESDSFNQNIKITTQNHNIPYDDKNSDKNNSSSIKIEKKNSKIPKFINKNSIMKSIHTKNERLVEIYIKNQVRKIIKFLEDKTKRQLESKQNIINDKNKNAIINSKSKEETFGDNNLLINSNDIKNIKSNEINELSLSFEVLNTSKSQTIINKEKNFCIKFFSNGSIYIGEVKNDKLSGHGKFMNLKGDIILGFFKDNCFHGYNLIQGSQNNSQFEGQFERNKFNGYGIVQFSDGSSYFGEYKNNEKSGIGTYTWENGCQYQGEWKNGKPNGLGIFIDNKSRFYEGEWKNGMMNGIGLFKWNDGRKYFGEFNNDKRDGFGIYFWNDPLKIYLGFWINGMQNGIGKIITSFKEKYYLWDNGMIVKKFSTKKDIASQIDEEERNKLKKYKYFFRLTLDDLFTFILDL